MAGNQSTCRWISLSGTQVVVVVAVVVCSSRGRLMERDDSSKDTQASDFHVAEFLCQPFSAAGKGRGLQDARGAVFRSADYMKPHMLVLMKRILSNDKGRA